MIEATLEHTGNNKTRVAPVLGISTKTLHAKLRLYRGGSEADSEEDAEEEGALPARL